MTRIIYWLGIWIFFSSCTRGRAANSDVDSFNGQITYIVDIETSDSGSIDRQRQLRNRFGDSITVKFGHSGFYEVLHMNTGDSGYVSKTYNNEIGENLIRIVNGEAYTRNVKLYGFKKKSVKKIENEIIFDKDCKCIIYQTDSYEDGKVTYTYCYDELTPFVNPEYFSNYTEQCLKDYFKMTKRPFLKYSQKTQKATITYTAVELTKTR